MTIRTDTEATDATPADDPGTEPEAVVEDPAAAAEGAPESGTSANEDEPELLESFKLEDVPEDLRPHVELYVKQAHGDYTRKTQAVARERAEVEELRQVAQGLASEDTREQALADFLAKHGYELADEDDDDAEEIELPDGETDDPVLSQLQELKQRLQERDDADEQARAQQAQDEFNQRVVGAVDEALGAFAKSEGVDSLPDNTRRLIINIAATLPRLPHGMPDMEGAIAQFEADRAAEVQRYVKSKKVTTPDVSGSSGQPKFDMRDETARLKAANAIAERSLARHA
jgi:hypothetical protein